MSIERREPSGRWSAVVFAIALGQAIVVLGPALGRGVAITHDMPWSPEPRLTPFVLGLDTPAPRVVPSDALGVLLGTVLGASLAQHLVLLGILVLLATGAGVLAAELGSRVGLVGRCVAAIAAVWNPFVFERLAVGQWVVLLGLGVLPWALRAALRAVRGTGSAGPLAGWIALASCGGVNAMVVCGLPVLLVVLPAAAALRTRPALWLLGLTVLVGAGVSAAWALPSLFAGAVSSHGGSTAFVPVADSPLGVLGSLLAGGGFWNEAMHPAARDNVLVAVTGAALMVAGVVTALVRAPGIGRWCLAVALVVMGLVVAVSISAPAKGLWEALVTQVPGGGALRDSHKLMSLWVVLGACGLGLLAGELLARRRDLGAPTAVLLLVLPVLLSPELLWGLGGRLEATEVPASYRTALEDVDRLAEGEVAVLPWSQYRRYPWNEDRVSLTLVPRMAGQPVLFDDSLPLRAGRVAGEDTRATEVTERIDDGASPVRALAQSRPRYVLAELRAGLPVDEVAVRSLGTVLVETADVLVVELAGEPAERSGGARDANVIGWGITALTWVVVVAAGVRRVTGARTYRLVRSRA